MSVNLTKGQRISLTKEFSALSNLQVGLGWDPVKQGLFRKAPNIDLDASVLMVDANGKLQSCIYYGNLCSVNSAVVHTGDNLTGEGSGDDETIYVDLAKIPENIHHLIFTVNIYSAQSRKQHFGMIQNAYIRLIDRSNGAELCRFNMSDDCSGKTALIVADVYRQDNEWKFRAVGTATDDVSISETAKRYQ